jgi:DNA-binding NarL/FixJ family response regulator
MLRILIADAEEVVRNGLREVIEARPDWEVCGEAADGAEALTIAAHEKPTVAILAIALPVLDGLALTRRLKLECPSINVLLFTAHGDDETIRGALATGARGYLLKTESASCIEAAIAERAANRPYYSACVYEFLLKAATSDHRRAPRLTTRELEVGQLLAEGRSCKEIALRLEIGLKTVESHRAAVMRKTGARTASECVRLAVKRNLIQGSP